MTEITRTEMGYAAWKESPTTVSEARKVATVNIASKRLNERLVESWAVPVVKFLTDIGDSIKTGGQK